MASEQIRSHESRIYHDLSRFYERIFSRVFGPRIHSTIQGLAIPPGARVLEIGVGTGLSLAAYPDHCHVTAIDLSQSMLDQAAEKISRNGYQNIVLQQMDAQNLEFPDGQFDYVMAFHVVTVVPDFEKMMSEMVRVCKPGGTLVVINHFRSPRRVVRLVVDALDRVTRYFGWRTTLSLEEVKAFDGFEPVRCFKTSPFSLFTVAVGRKPVSVPRPKSLDAASTGQSADSKQRA